MRVAVVDPSIFTPPYDQALIEALIERGVDARWIGRTPRVDDAVSAERIQPTPVFYELTERVRHKRPEFLMLSVKAIEHAWQSWGLVNYLLEKKFSVAHFQWTPVPLFDHLSIKRIRRHMPVVLTVHDTEVFHGNASHPLQRNGWQYVLRSVDRVIVHVHAAVKKLKRFGVDSNRIHVIPHPVFHGPDDKFRKQSLEVHSREALGFSSTRTNFLLFGRLAPYKGLETILDAVKGMSAEQASLIKIVIVGKPAFDVKAYEDEIKRLNLGDVLEVIPEFFEESKLVAYLDYSDVLLFPYLDIDASGALMQALPYRPAIIASDIGVFSEVLTNGHNALLIPPGCATQLRTAIEGLANDCAIRSTLRSGIGGLVDGKLSWSRAADATIAVYDAACRSRVENHADFQK